MEIEKRLDLGATALPAILATTSSLSNQIRPSQAQSGPVNALPQRSTDDNEAFFS